jgi:hypothetical protein
MALLMLILGLALLVLSVVVVAGLEFAADEEFEGLSAFGVC